MFEFFKKYTREVKPGNLTASSRTKLKTCHTDLQRLILEVSRHKDIVVATGYRNKDDQDSRYQLGYSKVMWPGSKHNHNPSEAVDIAPLVDGKVPWEDVEQFYYLAGYVFSTAERMSIRLRWGGDWDNDLNFTDQSFNDLGHFELLKG